MCLDGSASASRGRALQRRRKSKTLQLSARLGCEGRGRKAVLGDRGPTDYTESESLPPVDILSRGGSLLGKH